MLTAIYIEALLVDEELTDQAWELWNESEIGTYWAMWMRRHIAAASGRKQPLESLNILSGECPLLPNTSHSDANILAILRGCF
jgi:hypothetical protein